MKSSIPPEELDFAEQRLFESLAGDEPPKGAHHATAVALGLATATIATTITGAGAVAGASAVAGAGAGGSAAAKAGLAVKASTMLLVKWVGVGTLAGAVSVGAVRYAQRSPHSAVKPAATWSTLAGAKGEAAAHFEQKAAGEAPMAKPPAPIAAPAPVEAPPAQLAAPPVPLAEPIAPMTTPRTTGSRRTATLAPSTPAREAENVARDSTADTASPIAAPVPRAHPASLLAAEVAALDDVRRAINAKDGDRALSLLRRHARDFPSATLNLEATVLRIEALLLAGSTSEARDLGREFLASHPTSTHATRVRHLLAQHEKL